jgi:hypothetical protein
MVLSGLALVGSGCDRADDPADAPAGPQATIQTEPTRAADGEIAFLEAYADPSEILDEARAEAKRCDSGDASGCRALANRYETGIGAPSERARAIGLYDRGCADSLGYHCLLGGWLATATRDVEERARGLDLLRRACELDHLHGCVSAAALVSSEGGAAEAASLRAKACRGGYTIACDEGVEPAPATVTPSPEAACPAMFHWTVRTGGDPGLHEVIDQLDHEAMLATIPESLAGFTTERRTSTSAGQAGTRLTSAAAGFAKGESRISLSLIDQALNCTMQPGTGAAMVASTKEQGGRAREVHEFPAVAVGPTLVSPLALTVWIADRCELTMSATGSVTEAELDSLVEQLDWPELQRLCSQRP